MRVTDRDNGVINRLIRYYCRFGQMPPRTMGRKFTFVPTVGKNVRARANYAQQAVSCGAESVWNWVIYFRTICRFYWFAIVFIFGLYLCIRRTGPAAVAITADWKSTINQIRRTKESLGKVVFCGFFLSSLGSVLLDKLGLNSMRLTRMKVENLLEPVFTFVTQKLWVMHSADD